MASPTNRINDAVRCPPAPSLQAEKSLPQNLLTGKIRMLSDVILSENQSSKTLRTAYERL